MKRDDDLQFDGMSRSALRRMNAELGKRPEIESQEPDKLDLAVAALRKNPNLTNEQLAQVLGLKRAFSAIFWKLRAKEILAAEQ